jgi:hypothetical protein
MKPVSRVRFEPGVPQIQVRIQLVSFWGNYFVSFIEGSFPSSYILVQTQETRNKHYLKQRLRFLYEFVMPTRLKNLGRNSARMRSLMVFSWFVAAICSPSSQRPSICLSTMQGAMPSHPPPPPPELFSSRKHPADKKGRKKFNETYIPLARQPQVGHISKGALFWRAHVNLPGTWRCKRLIL